MEIAEVSNDIKIVQNKKELYFGHNQDPSGEEIASRIISDAIWSGALPAKVDHSDCWWNICGQKDWLIGPDGRPDYSYFFNITPFPSAGVNSFRSEILVNAFARNVVTISPKYGIKIIKGDLDVNEITKKEVEYNDVYLRKISFTM